MKKIITFICFVLLCVGLNSCAVYTTDDNYGYRSGSHYHTHSVYYRPVHYPTRRYYSRPTPPSHKPKPHYHRPKPKPTHHPNSHRPHNRPHNRHHNSRDNHNHNRR
jgi:hypothetical protein